ncbi:hypothetical protein [Usitatibacter palustris]|uniref:Uncharacterized protein n=1 Tax=Usitatibacter palustris TaxID=2732487 RepID=A0A6M4HAJ9_9PROT|nr:hypothetical protein [Usitatibacter palustris]QJR16581.1 hypothetical protein DSM104440_03416 [Usitatibacter palustris]
MFKKGTLALATATLAIAALVPSTVSASIEDIQIVNTDPWNRTVWVTIIPNMQGGKTKKQAFCLKPREIRKHSVDMSASSSITSAANGFTIQGEVTRNQDCQQPVDCSSTKSVDLNKPGSRIYRYETDHKRCYWLEHVDTQPR